MSSRLIFLLIAVAVAWILAFNSGRDLAYNLAYLLTAVLAISYFWARLSLRAVGLRRFTRTQRSQVGQFAEEQFEVSNRSVWPKLWLEIEDRSTLPWHAASRVVNSLGRQGVQRWQVKTLCTQRGRFRLGPVVLRSGDPLGIFDAKQELARTNYLTVYPLTVEITSFEPSISDLSGGEARHRRTNEITSNVSTVREYVQGDSLNRIHWPSSVRARRLMSKEFELDPTADIWIYLDLYREVEGAMPWTPEPPEPGLFALHTRRRQKSTMELPPVTTEYGIVVGASLGRYFLNRNRAVGMSCHGRTREFLQADRGERQMNKMLEALAVVEAQGSFPFANLIATDGSRLNRNDTVIAISPDPNPAWAFALHQLQRRGVNSVAIVVDGSTFGRATDYNPLYIELEAAGIPTYIITRTDPIDRSLAHPAHSARARSVPVHG
jgi:uncharacterized protein (DUF58 family)